MDTDQDEAISSLVRQYLETRGQWLLGRVSASAAHDLCGRVLRLIDAEVLKAYNLAPRTERILLDYFSGQRRPGPTRFTEYFPDSFKPCIPLHRYLSDELETATAKSTIGRLPVIDDSIISAAMEDLLSESPN